MIRLLLIAIVFLCLGTISFSQVLNITDNSPNEHFINEEFCYTDVVTNVGVGTPGYGPYFRVEVPPNVTLNSASFLGSPITLNNLGVSTGPAFADPLIQTGTPADSIFAAVGNTVYIVQMPVGSIVDGGPLMEIEWCWTISLAATVGVPESIEITPVYQFGDTPTGANGPLLFPVVTESVIPIAYRLTKVSNNFEQEKAPGSCLPVEYTINVDIANGVTLNNLVVSDVLPVELQFNSILSNGGCTETTLPSTVTPGGNLVITCPSATGTLGSADVQIIYEAYVIDYLDETVCDSEQLFNAASASTSSFPPQTAADTSSIQHAIIVHSNNAGGNVNIGQTVTYTIATEVSEYTAGLNAYSVEFVVPDGMVYDPASLTWGGAALNPLNVTVVPGPGTGSTVTVDLFAENGGPLIPCTIPAIQYQADVNETYLSGENVLGRDVLSNTSASTYGLVEGANNCTNASAIGIEVVDASLTKIINNTPPTGPGRNGEWIPGDVIQYQIALVVPSTDLDNVIITDYLPIPIHDVTTLAPAFGTDVTFDGSSAWTTPPVGYTLDATTNSLILDFGDISNTVTGGSVDIVINIDIVISTEPYANGLQHSNFAGSISDNSAGDNIVGTVGTVFTVGAPDLTFDKNVVSSDNGSATIDGTGNITGVDALDTVRFELVATNVGDAQAYDVTFTDVVPVGLSNCALETTNPVALIGGAPLGFTGGFVGNNLSVILDDTISFAGDPGADAAVVSFYCIVDPATVPEFTLTNTAEVTWTQAPMGVPFAPESSEAMVTAGSPSVNKDIDSLYPSNLTNNDVTIGDFVQYEVVVEIPEGQMDNVVFRDRLDLGLAFVQIESITASSADVSSSLGTFPSLIGSEVLSPIGGGQNGVDRIFDLNLGSVLNTNTDNTVIETITIVYTTSVLNIAPNVRGVNRNNRFDVIWDDPNGGGTLFERDNAPNVTIVEPELTLAKGYLDNTLVPGEETFVTLTVDHSGLSDATAYDVELVDTLPLGMNYVAGFDNLSGTFTATPNVTVLGNILTVSMDSITVSQDITYAFRVELDPAYPICDTVTNCSYVRWESLYAPTQVGLPVGVNNVFVGERTGDTSDIGNINNTYVVQSCAPLFSTNNPTDPTITSTPQTCEGGQVTLSVDAYTGSVVEYNWNGPGVPAGGVNSNVIIIDPVTFADTGDYFIVVNVDGCVSDTSQLFNLQIYENPTVAPINNGTLCMDPSVDLQLTSNAADGTVPYSFNWTGPNSFSSISANPIIPNPDASNSGDYNVIVTDNNGCTAVGNSLVSISEIPNQPVVSSNTPVCEGENLTISTQTYSGSSVTYFWEGPSGAITNNSNILNFSPTTLADAGTYSIWVEVDGCISDTTLHTVQVNPNPAPLVSATSSPVCGEDTLFLFANNTTGSTYTYNWTGPNGFSSSLENPFISNATSVNSGFYNLTIIDSNSCSVAMSVQATVLNALDVPSISSANTDFCLGDVVTINVLPAYSGTNVTYNWSTPNGPVATTVPQLIINPATVADAGSYFIASVNVDGCLSQASNTVAINVTDNSTAPIATADNTTVCEGDFFSLSTSTVADSYSWTGPNGFTSTSATPTAIEGSALTAGTYSLTVTINGCVSPAGTVDIIVNAAPAAPTISGTTSLCEGDDIVLSTSSTCDNFLWIGPGGSSTTTLTNPLLNTTTNTTTIPFGDAAYASGQWSVVCVSADGCESEASSPITLTINPIPVAIANNDGPICENGDVTLIGNTQSGATYEWYDEFFTTLLATSPTHMITGLANGTYTFNYIVTSNGCADTAGTVVTVSTVLAPPTITTNSTSLCEGDILLLSTPTNADSYLWTGPNGFSSTSSVPTGIVASPATAGTYNLSVVINGCGSATASETITVDPLPQTPVLSASNTVCDGDDITLSTTDVATNYYWMAPSGDTVITAVNNLTVADTDPNYGTGSWSLFVENANGCFSNVSNAENVTVNPLPVALASNNGPICANADATLTGNTATGGSYEWYDEFYTTLLSTATTHTESNLAPGTYTFNYILNVNGCVDTATTVVTVDPALAAPIATADNTTVCEGDFFSLSTSTVADGYSWTGPNGFTSTSATPAAIEGSTLTVGTYSLTVTINGCVSPAGTVDIIVNPAPAAPTISGTTSLCEGDDIVLSTSSTCDNFLWIGPGGSSTTTLTNPLLNTTTNTTTIPFGDAAYASGQWSVVCVSADGCESETSSPITLTINPIPVAIANNDGPICENGDVMLIGNTQSGATYEWYDEFFTTLLATSPTHMITGLANGTYTFNYMVTSNGCEDTASTVVTVSTVLAPPTITTNSTSLCEGDLLLLSTPTNADSYLWTGPNGFSSTSSVPTGIVASPATAGTYNLSVVINGCGSATASETITVDPLPQTPVLSASNTVCDGDDITLSTTDVATNYYWMAPSGDTVITAVNNLTVADTDPNYGTGSWSLFVENANGCFSNVSNAENLTVNPLPVALASNNGPICANGDATLTGNTATGGSYEWYDEFYTTLLSTATTHTESNLAPGTYTFNYILNVNGCVDTATTVVTVDPALAAPTATADNTTVCEGDFFSLSTSTVADSYSWTGPNGFTSTSATPTAIEGSALTAGTYSLTVTINGCVSPAGTVDITVDPLPQTPVLSASNAVCDGDDIALSTTDVATNYFWMAPSGDTVITAVNNLTVVDTDPNYGTGSWSMFVENANGCFSNVSNVENVTVNPLPVALANNNGPICANGDATLTGNTATGGSYEWYDEFYTTLLSTATTHTESNLAPGTYTFNYILNVNGCVDTATTIVTVNPALAAPLAATTDATPCEGDFFSVLSITAADSYSWTGPNGFTSTSATPAAIEASAQTAGTYSFVVTINGCESPAGSVNVTVNPLPPTPTISGNTALCEGDDIVLTTSSSCDNFLWIGPGGSSTSTLTNPLLNTTTNTTTIPAIDSAYAAGQWSVVCVSPEGCESEASLPITITINAFPDTAIASSNSPVCIGEDIQLNANTVASATYTWTGTNGYFSSDQNPIIGNAQLSDAADYSVTISVNGCSTSSVVPTSVLVNAPPAAPSPTSNSPVCEGDTIWLFSNTSATTYTWTGPNGFFSTQDTAFVANSDSTNSGFYNLITTVGGCSSPVGQVEVDVIPTSFVPSISAVSDTVCNGQILELQASGLGGVNAEYIWYGPSGVLDTTANPTYILSPVSIADSGEYYVQTLIGACVSLPSQVVLIDVNPTPATPDITFTSPICEGEAIVVSTNTLADAYDWVGPNGFNSDLQNPDAIMPATTLNSGNYSLAVTIDGCTSADSIVTVTVNPTPTTPLIFGTSPICVGDSLIVYTNNVATEYLWTLPDMTTVLQTNDSLIIEPSVLSDAGTYGLQLVEQGCASALVSVEITIQDSISSLPFAGFDFVVCDGQTVANLSAENNGTGFWSTPTNANIITPDSTQTIVTNLEQDSTYSFVWTLTNGVCGNAGTDTIELYIASDPIANGDSLTISEGQTEIIDVLANDSIPLSSNYTIFQNADNGTTEILSNGISYTAGSGSFSDQFIYELCLDACPSMCDTALVSITMRPEINVPDLITPNGDGTNDAFVIEGIENFPENELTIFNRWGNEIFRAENYQNDWEGQFNNEELPVGTYFYVFINLEDGELIINGYITLQR